MITLLRTFLSVKFLLGALSRMVDLAFLSLALCMIASVFVDFGSSMLTSLFSQVSVCRGAMLAFRAMK